MGKQVTLGGDRLGSGKKVKQELHNYFRSTHNLSQSWTSPMTVGALYPFLVLPAMRNDKFQISLNADCVTVPTKGPLFGSFKLQLDVFQCPIRLYQAILHNNPTNIGLKMNQVLLPTYQLEHFRTGQQVSSGVPVPALNNSCLWKYLGLSGIGQGGVTSGGGKKISRQFNAVPLLAYYDIFKNYYSNKQEDNAYVISNQITTDHVVIDEILVNGETLLEDMTYDVDITNGNPFYLRITGRNLWAMSNSTESIIEFADANAQTIAVLTATSVVNCIRGGEHGGFDGWSMRLIGFDERNYEYYEFEVTPNATTNTIITSDTWSLFEEISREENLHLNSFPLKNIDDMRMAVLSAHTLGTPFRVDQQNYKPYNENTYEKSQKPLNGLVVKTYQSDMFNNWINTEWIDGDNGIAEITKISTSDGAFKIDQLNLAEKLYNMLNRVAVSGGTYEDWQDAVYDQAPHKHIESPIYLGGLSSEIVFEQIVANTAASVDGVVQPLGDLAGRGRFLKRKGGHISVKCDEASFIIGIVSITPRIKYTQGNEFYLTELKSLDDLHKPALDGIGFQNLLGERLHWADTLQKADGTFQRSVVGKLPAWMEYMTAVDKTFGDFAEEDGKAFMSLNRNYDFDYESGTIDDVTTYIDPTKFNYAFAHSELEAQNFWCEIQSNIIARRKMSAKQIPNL